MKIKSYSIKEAIENVKINPNNWISIRDIVGYEKEYFIFDNYVSSNCLRIICDDTSSEMIEYDMTHPIFKNKYKNREPILFNERMAYKIKQFTDYSLTNNLDINIHCVGGYSRSVTIASCLNIYCNLYRNRNIEDFISNINLKCCANSEIVRVMFKILFNKENIVI